MSYIGYTRIIAPLRPPNPGSTMALAGDVYLSGGYRVVDTIVDRDNIPTYVENLETDIPGWNRRKEGMLVYVKDEDKTYRLKDGLTNDHWVEVGEGDPGASVELREHDGWVEWRWYDQDPEDDWKQLFEIPEGLQGDQGDPGATIELREHDGWVEWRWYDQDPEDDWKQLFEIPEGADGIEDVFVEPSMWPNFSILKYTKDSTDYFVTHIHKPTGLSSGGGVSWAEGYTFHVGAAFYHILGEPKSTSYDTVTLSAAHSTLDRIDVIAVDADEQIIILEGTPAESPIKPQVDPLEEIELTSVFVGAGTAQPVITEEVVYDENVEWTGSYLASPALVIDFEDEDHPFTGSLATNVSHINRNDRIVFERGTVLDARDFEVFSFAIKLKQFLHSRHRLVVYFLKQGILVGSAVQVALEDTIDYQVININTEDFNLSDDINKVFFEWRGTGGGALPDHEGFYLDTVRLSGGIEQPGIPAISVHIGYASDDSGSDFSKLPAEGLNYIAFVRSILPNEEIAAGHFAGLWRKYIGDDGEPGATIELREHDGWVEWRWYDQSPPDTWKQLFEIPEGGNGGVGITKQLRGYGLVQENWVEIVENALYKYVITDVPVGSNQTVEIIASRLTDDVIAQALMFAEVEVEDNEITVYCKQQPTGDILVTINTKDIDEQEDITHTVTFEPVDDEGDPVTDAVVTFRGETKPAGQYVFEEVPAGVWPYEVVGNDYTREGYITVVDDITQVIPLFDVEEEFTNTHTGSTGDLQEYEVSFTGKYKITAYGAQGGAVASGNIESEGGKGAKIVGEFELVAGDVLKILVGQEGGSATSSGGQAGGGGTFVVKVVTSSDYYHETLEEYVEPLVVAGGGAGTRNVTTGSGNLDGRADNRGIDYEPEGNINSGGAGAGGGFMTEGSGHANNIGQTFLQGGEGGGSWAVGGFGGGGGKGSTFNDSAGGGGFDGGDSSYNAGEGGGGSLNADENGENQGGVREGHGFVKIEYL